ncbi:unnamed protein product [Cyprideis torosa]|uniref:Uncharacterized protein n=1 Tax=Cyprideis torosa TaxID=163714 RepID=A0A7R8WP59_9CRUS|nr:unnamed protein product [Cyprideis torosa]CAG0906967.1 unnamed protein product [Cyprideis torosa]
MQRILIFFAHPALHRSKINAALLANIEGIEGITIHDLYASYPDFLIDVEHEQRLCEEHDILVFQHPFYWYSTPAIVKEWFDLVLEHDWAYGSRGTALQNKYIFQALTAGGDEATYQKKGHNNFTLAELTSPFQATAKLCGMKWLPPFAVLGVHRGLPPSILGQHAEEYRTVLLALRDGRLNVKRLTRHERLNANIQDILNN